MPKGYRNVADGPFGGADPVDLGDGDVSFLPPPRAAWISEDGTLHADILGRDGETAQEYSGDVTVGPFPLPILKVYDDSTAVIWVGD